MATRTSTAAGKRRAAARSAVRRGHQPPAPAKRTPAAPKRATTAPAKRAPAKRAKSPVKRAKAPVRRAKPAAKRSKAPARRSAPAPRRATTRRAPARRKPATRRTAKAPKQPLAKRLAKLPGQLPRPRTAILIAAAVAGLLGAAWFGLRDSSLVAVQDVEVSGLTSPVKAEVEGQLTEAAKGMSTLHFDQAKLDKAVAGYPTVVSVSADPDFPHGVAIDVVERPPVLMAAAGGEQVPVGPDGTLLRGLELSDDARGALPVLDVKDLPASGKLGGEDLTKALVLGAAPDPLRPLIEGVSIEGERGVEVTMKGDIPIRFGTPDDAQAKWAAAAAVLADPKLDTLTYVDVRVAERPAVGGAAPAPAPEEPVDPAVTTTTDPATVDPATTAVDPATTTTDPATVTADTGL